MLADQDIKTYSKERICEGHEILHGDLPDKILFEYITERLKDPVKPRNFEWPSLHSMLETKMNLRGFLEEIENNSWRMH